MSRQWRIPPASDHYQHGRFHNLIPTTTLSKDRSMLSVLMDRFRRTKAAIPDKAIPSVKTSLKELPPDQPMVVWFGHSSYLVSYRNVRILVDPVFSGHASPLPGMIKAFKGSNVYQVNDLPEIDYLVITHNHYDHLDRKTVASLLPKTKKICTSLGAGKYLPLGHSDIPVMELDWWETEALQDGVTLTACPARHFSGRGLVQNESLWSSFALQLFDQRIFIGGDSGYGPHFKAIGDKFGPFDLALLECGQYNLAWHDIHLLPEETAQAAMDLGAKVLMPVHWGKFALANHEWNEPVRRLLVKAGELKLKLTTPMIGEPVSIGKSYPSSHWWEQ
jgi:L-ascorbate metabolism protein UlaG (beta-lactamase superfamily)